MQPTDRAGRIAAALRELAELEGPPEPPPLAPRARRNNGPSTVYTVRLDHEEVAALERRAAVVGVRPSSLARNFIRIGLSRGAAVDVSHAVDRVAGAVAELRALVP